MCMLLSKRTKNGTNRKNNKEIRHTEGKRKMLLITFYLLIFHFLRHLHSESMIQFIRPIYLFLNQKFTLFNTHKAWPIKRMSILHIACFTDLWPEPITDRPTDRHTKAMFPDQITRWEHDTVSVFFLDNLISICKRAMDGSFGVNKLQMCRGTS